MKDEKFIYWRNSPCPPNSYSQAVQMEHGFDYVKINKFEVHSAQMSTHTFPPHDQQVHIVSLHVLGECAQQHFVQAARAVSLRALSKCPRFSFTYAESLVKKM
jgi:hypothetical protein